MFVILDAGSLRFPIRADDIKRLSSKEWLNDKIIENYLSIICNVFLGYAFLSTDFARPTILARNPSRWLEKIQLDKSKFLYIPVNTGGHWILAFLDIEKRILSCYDSMLDQNIELDPIVDDISDALQKSLNIKIKVKREWCPQQRNFSDCGVYILQVIIHHAMILIKGTQLH